MLSSREALVTLSEEKARAIVQGISKLWGLLGPKKTKQFTEEYYSLFRVMNEFEDLIQKTKELQKYAQS